MLQNTLYSLLTVTSAFVVLAAGTSLAGETVPEGAKPWPELSKDGVHAHVGENTLWLQVDKVASQAGRVVIPRLCASIRSVVWCQHPDALVKVAPEPNEWIFSWKPKGEEDALLKIRLDTQPLLPVDCPIATPNGDGSVMLHAYQANTFGEKLRFEPQWYKNTVGYWAVATDYATWKLKLDAPGTYSVAVLQGCGSGQGGSDAKLTLSQADKVEAEVSFQTIDTGHFQNFRWNHLGFVTVTTAGEYELRIAPVKIAKGALFDVRTIHLVKQATAAQ
ncbi:MAG: hypothetical protein KDA66_03375 [Planctomycetaceae bacterium]|nr:hypothetical protein [Planctomycetaceae bacterium]